MVSERSKMKKCRRNISRKGLRSEFDMEINSGFLSQAA
jgi:hypothetical protein